MARINPMMFPDFTGMGQQTNTQQTPDTLAEMTRLLGGDLSGSLTSGDKLLALSGLLRSATRSGRRAGITPQQVIGQLQQQKLAELQNRVAVEQAQTARTQQQQQRQFRAQFLATLPEQERRAVSFLDDTALQQYAVKRSEGPELTPAEKALVAANIDPKSPEGQEILNDVARSLGLVPVSGPLGITFVRASQAGGAPTIPAPKTKQEYDALPPGTEFIDPNGTRRTKPGGQTGATAPSGGFR
jgi:hypothetical protein